MKAYYNYTLDENNTPINTIQFNVFTAKFGRFLELYELISGLKAKQSYGNCLWHQFSNPFENSFYVFSHVTIRI